MHYDQGSSILGLQKWFNIRNSINVIHYVNRLKEENQLNISEISKNFSLNSIPIATKTLSWWNKGLSRWLPPAKQEMWVSSLGQENSMEKEMATHSSILA